MLKLFFFLICFSFTQNNEKLNLTFSKDSNQSSIVFIYSMRFSSIYDFANLYLVPFKVYYTFSSTQLRDFVIVRYYGVKSYPLRYFMRKKTEYILLDNENKDYSYREKYNLKLFDIFDIKEGLDYYFIDMLMRNISYKWSEISKQDKKIFINDLGLLNIPIIKK